MSRQGTPVSSAEDALARARSALGKKIEYKLGKGGFKPVLTTPAPADQCDCSGYIAWCLGLSRRVSEPFHGQVNGGWLEPTGVYKDILSPWGFFKALDEPRVGCVVVYPDQNGHDGHIGLVTEVKDKKPSRVIHCSSSAWKRMGNAIAGDRNKALTDNPSVRYGWFSGYSDYKETPLAPISPGRSAEGSSMPAAALIESASLLSAPGTASIAGLSLTFLAP